MESRKLGKAQYSDNRSSEMRLYMVVTPDILTRFIRLLSQGFLVDARADCTINDLLGQDLGIDAEYIDRRIQTIFLNGKAVDDTKSARISPGSSLALSAAMPGMVGSTFRKAGVFAGMRSQISHDSGASMHHDGNIRITIKLFNLVAKELGPGFFQKGVWLKGKHLHDFISQNFDYLRQGCKSLKLDEQTIDINQLSDTDFTNRSVFLKIMAPVDA
jgi:hypothetical protein